MHVTDDELVFVGWAGPFQNLGLFRSDQSFHLPIVPRSLTETKKGKKWMDILNHIQIHCRKLHLKLHKRRSLRVKKFMDLQF
jgi:hypothetical protein